MCNNSTAKLNHDSNLISIISWHNHGHSGYNNDIYLLKAKCKEDVKTSRCNLRKVFNHLTRSNSTGRKISFPVANPQCIAVEGGFNPKFPKRFPNIISNCQEQYSVSISKFLFLKAMTLDLSFFSDEITSIMLDISEICFDCTFFTVPVQFYQLWTIFIVIDLHVIPAIHCLLTEKSEELCQAVLSKIQEIPPQFQPQIAMSDWEQAARNALKRCLM